MVIVSKKQLDKLMDNALKITYSYLVETLKVNQIEAPNLTYENYIKALTDHEKNLKNNNVEKELKK